MGSRESLMGGFFRFRVLVDAGTRGRGDAGTRRKISERKNRLFQTEYEKPTLERSREWDVVRLRSPLGR
ncbi:MAG: hypothetical protein KME21_03455 [Desmonostoc vinosum HA7617-LM4]|nr:hypothetical protein [Desmonostoc vinosum HA7617-LM4]